MRPYLADAAGTIKMQLKLAIEDTLDTSLPHAYDKPLYEQKCSASFERVPTIAEAARDEFGFTDRPHPNPLPRGEGAALRPRVENSSGVELAQRGASVSPSPGAADEVSGN